MFKEGSTSAPAALQGALHVTMSILNIIADTKVRKKKGLSIIAIVIKDNKISCMLTTLVHRLHKSRSTCIV